MNTATDDQDRQTVTSPLSDEIRAFLAPARFATLATIDPDGTPHQAVIWYDLDGDHILVNSRRPRHWPANIERNEHVHLAVFDIEEPTHWVGIKGRARLIRDGDQAQEDIYALARRYRGDPEKYRGQERVTFEIEVERTFEYGRRS